jgi:chromosome segregation and condensation protein ScpB
MAVAQASLYLHLQCFRIRPEAGAKTGCTNHMNTQEAKIVLETALICAQEPLRVGDLRRLFADDVGADTIRFCSKSCATTGSSAGVELVALASGWRFQSRPEMREFLTGSIRRSRRTRAP